MFLTLKRILMSEADAGSGNGAAVPATSTEPAEVPQAQGGAVTLSKAEIDELVSSAAKQAAKAAHDAAFAEARRTFTGAKKSEKPKADEAPQSQALSATDERMFLRGLDRELAKLGVAPNSAQYARAERDLLADRPDDVSSWAKDYFDGWGGAKPQPAQTQTVAAAAKPVSEHPVSNRGAPPPAQTPIEELDLFTASDSDRAAFIKAKGSKAYVTLLQKQAKGRTVRFT